MRGQRAHSLRVIPPGKVTTHPAQGYDGLVSFIAPSSADYSIGLVLCVIQNPPCGDGIVYSLLSPLGVVAANLTVASLACAAVTRNVTLAAGERFTLQVAKGGDFLCDTTTVDFVVTRLAQATTPPPPTTAPPQTTTPPLTTALPAPTSPVTTPPLPVPSPPTQSPSLPPSAAPRPASGALVVSEDLVVEGSWSAPPVVVFSGGTVIVRFQALPH